MRAVKPVLEGVDINYTFEYHIVLKCKTLSTSRGSLSNFVGGCVGFFRQGDRIGAVVQFRCRKAWDLAKHPSETSHT